VFFLNKTINLMVVFRKFELMLRKFFAILIVSYTVTALILSSGCRRQPTEDMLEEALDSIPAMGFWPDSLKMVESRISDGEHFAAIMVRLGMNATDANQLALSIPDSVMRLNREPKSGKTMKAYYDTTLAENASVPQYVVYERDRSESVIFKTTQPLGAWVFTKPVEHEKKTVDVVIRTNLYNDMIAGGGSRELACELADILEWSIDFFSLQDGDEFKAYYQQTTCDGEVIAIDTIYYAEFHRDTTMIPAIRYDQGDGGNKYWKSNGESLRKAFLKVPLQFSRISSGFTYHRKHPVTGKVRPHTAIDYAAPIGTPVRSIGDGTVLSAGWAGGGGNTVKVRHTGGYVSSYMHLRNYGSGIRSGVHVRQGQVIGYVGSTGMSTGPHLDFRVYKDGTPINPLKVVSPPQEPIRKENLAALDSAFVRYKHTMDSLMTR